MTPGKETALAAISTTHDASDDLPDDPATLKKLLLEERRARRESHRENMRLIDDHWDNAMDAMVVKSLKAATFVAHPQDGRIIRWSDPAGLCCPEDDDAAGSCVYSVIFDRLRDPRDMSSSGEDTGVHRIPRLFGEEFKEKLAQAMRSDGSAIKPLKRSMQSLFHYKEAVLLESPTRGTIDVLLAVSYGLDHNGHGWLHVAIVDIDAINCDDLTGLWGRKTFKNSLTRDVAECKRSMHGGPGNAPSKLVSVVMFDADGMKRINDEHGHFVGDQVIKTMARRAQKLFNRPTDLLARIGGDEFVAKMHGSSEEAHAQGENVRQAICGKPISARVAPDSDQKIMIHLSISVGIATFEGEEDTAATLLKRADEGLYDSKHGGRNRTSTRMKAFTLP